MSTFWCRVCQLRVGHREATQLDDSFQYEFWGERGMHRTTVFKCPACDEELNDYEGQDEDNSAPPGGKSTR